MTTPGPTLEQLLEWFVAARAAHAARVAEDAEAYAQHAAAAKITASVLKYGQQLRALAQLLHPDTYDGRDWSDEIPF